MHPLVLVMINDLTMMFALIVLFITLVNNNDAARILGVFPVPSISHQVVFRPLTQELAKRGHQITVITADPAFEKGRTPPNLTEIDVHDFSYENWERLYEVTSSGDNDLVIQMKVAFEMLNKIFEMQLNLDEIQRLIKEETFDLLLIEACARSALVMSHVFKAPVILVSSFGPMSFNVDTIGSSWHPLLYPNNLSQRVYNLSSWDKLKELWRFYRLEKVMNEVEVLENEMARRMFGPNVPTISELKNNVDMMFLNIRPLWDGNRPVPPSVIYMGGLHQKPVKELPKDLKTYLDSSKHGVVYMSLGTNVQPSRLPAHRIKMLIKVFSELPYDILWKWDKDELPGQSKNIRISKWLPQSDLLRHPKIKVFITQGGLQSTDEAITAGVPLIGIPMLGDQWFNTEKYIHHKIGVKLDMDSLNEEEFRSAINKVIGDPSYRYNIIRLQSLMKDEPQAPLDRAVWWTEYVLRHGGAKHLRSPAANIPWTQYLELELLLPLVGIVMSLVLAVLYIVYQSWKYFVMKEVHLKLKMK